MRNLSERLRLPKGKSLFISTAIATLLVQPFYMSLSSNTAFAATNPGDFTVAQEQSETPPATVAVGMPDGPNKNGVYSGTFNIEGTATAPKNSTLENVTHTFTINPALGENPTIYTEVGEIVDGVISTASFDFDSLGLNYPDDTYTITHTATYIIVGETEDRTDFSTSDSIDIEIDNQRPTASLTLPTEIFNSQPFTITIDATSKDGVIIDRVEVTLYKEGGEFVRYLTLTPLPEGKFQEILTVAENGDYFITYEAFTARDKGSIAKESETFTITTPEQEQEPEPGGNPPGGDDDEDGGPVTGPIDSKVDTPTNGGGEDARNEDDEPEDDEDKDDIKDTLLGAATFSTGLMGNADPFFTEIIGGPTIPLDNNSQGQDSEDEGSTSSTSTKPEVDERGVVQFLGISWYWWVAMLAGATSIWSLVIAGRNRMTEGGL